MSTTTTTKTEFTIPQEQLANGLASVIHAMDSESSRWALAGARVVIMPGEITFVATDGRRMAWRRIEIDHGLEPIQFTIPAKEAKALSRMYSKGNAIIEIDSDPIKAPIPCDSIRKIVVKWRNGRRKDQTTSFEPLAGRYPKWQEVVASSKPNPAIGELSGPADLLLPYFAPEDGITLSVNGKATASGKSQEMIGKRILQKRGKKSESIQHSGEFSIRVSRDFMTDVLSACGKASVTIKVSDSHSAVWIECETGLCSVIMPLSE